ncbi:MAG: HYC_CC_PP family protein [Sphingobacteriaceae bacterium]
MKYRWFNSIMLLVAFTYVFSTFGISAISHYCGGELQEVAFFTTPDSCCGDEPVEDDGCCKNEEEHVSFHSDFVFVNLNKEIKPPVILLPFISQDINCNVLSVNYAIEKIAIEKQYPPPDLVQQDIISVSVLRI